MKNIPIKTRVRAVLLFFVVALLASGLTAFPLQWELNILNQLVAPLQAWLPDLVAWVSLVNRGLQETYRQYPFLAYGTDWLAFAHIVIAFAFIGPLRDPVRNIWVIEWAMIACVLVIPLAAITGPLRGIPFYWTLVDWSCGVFGIVPLWWCRREILHLTSIEKGTLTT